MRTHAKPFSALAAMVFAIGAAGLTHVAVAQRAEQEGQGQAQGQGQGNAPAPTIDAATGKVLNEAIELLNMENYAGAKQKIGTLNLEKLSPYERSKVEQILFSIAVTEEKYDEARQHLKAAIDAGGFNEQEISQARYQYAQLFMQEEKWKEGAAALEEWFTDGDESKFRRLLSARRGVLPDGRSQQSVGARPKSRGAHGQAPGGVGAAIARSVPRGGAAPGRDTASRALDRARAGQEDLLDAALVGLRPHGGLSEGACCHAASVLGRPRDRGRGDSPTRRPAAIQ